MQITSTGTTGADFANTDRAGFETKEKVKVGGGNQTIGFDPTKLGNLKDYLGDDGILRIPNVGDFSPSDDFDYAGTLQKLETALGDVMAGADGALDALKSLLGELGIGDDLSTLIVEFAAMGRQNALDQRLASREQAKSELLSQAATTRTAAVTQAIVAGVALAVSILSAGVSVGGAKAASASADEVADVVAQGGDQAQLAMINTAATATQASNQATTQVINTFGQLAQGVGGVVSGNIQADGQVDAANAQMEQSNSDLSKKVMDDFEEIVRATIQFLKEMQQAETDLMANMTRV